MPRRIKTGRSSHVAVGIDVPFGATPRRGQPARALAMPLIALPENVRHAGVGGGLRNARSNDIYQPSHAAACGLVFSSLDHAWLLNALLTGALAWPGPILQNKKRRLVARLPPNRCYGRNGPGNECRPQTGRGNVSRDDRSRFEYSKCKYLLNANVVSTF